MQVLKTDEPATVFPALYTYANTVFWQFYGAKTEILLSKILV